MKGWHNDNYRHSLAARGVRTSFAGYLAGGMKTGNVPIRWEIKGDPTNSKVRMRVDPSLWRESKGDELDITVDDAMEKALKAQSFDKITEEALYSPYSSYNDWIFTKDDVNIFPIEKSRSENKNLIVQMPQQPQMMFITEREEPIQDFTRNTEMLRRMDEQRNFEDTMKLMSFEQQERSERDYNDYMRNLKEQIRQEKIRRDMGE